jgi:hypothetical protein
MHDSSQEPDGGTVVVVIWAVRPGETVQSSSTTKSRKTVVLGLIAAMIHLVHAMS